MPMRVSAGGVMKLLRKLTEAEIARQVNARGAGKTICPSEVARALDAEWRALMPVVRAAADAMAVRGEIVVTQKGREVAACRARGPVRIGLPG